MSPVINLMLERVLKNEPGSLRLKPLIILGIRLNREWNKLDEPVSKLLSDVQYRVVNVLNPPNGLVLKRNLMRFRMCCMNQD